MPCALHFVLEAVTNLDRVSGGDDLAVRSHVIKQQLRNGSHARCDFNAQWEPDAKEQRILIRAGAQYRLTYLCATVLVLFDEDSIGSNR